MLIVTIVIPDTGGSEMAEAADRLEALTDELGGQVLQAHTIAEDCGDLDACDAHPIRGLGR